MRPSVKDRLMAKVSVSDAGCWEWRGGMLGGGYGAFSKGGRTLYAHRASYAEFVGDIPCGMFVCHRCDNPKCVNPQHLFLGSPADNMRDKAAKGRSMRGEKSSTAKLSQSNVIVIKKFLEIHPPVRGQHGGPCSFLARWFGVSQTGISLIHAGKNWAWLELPSMQKVEVIDAEVRNLPLVPPVAVQPKTGASPPPLGTVPPLSTEVGGPGHMRVPGGDGS